MAEIIIKTTDDERRACLQAIIDIGAIAHVKHMSLASIAESAGIKATKCRAVLDDVVQTGLATKYCATDNPKVQRYYYVVSASGHEFLEKNNNGNET